VAVLSGDGTGGLIPRALVLPRPSQHLQVPTLSGASTGALTPRAVVCPRPPQPLQLPGPGESFARGRTLPRAAVRHGPDECRQGLAKRRDADPRLLRAATDALQARADHCGADRALRPPEQREVEGVKALEQLLLKEVGEVLEQREKRRARFGRSSAGAPLGRGHLQRRRHRRQRAALRRSEDPGAEPGVVPRAVPGQRMLGRPTLGDVKWPSPPLPPPSEIAAALPPAPAPPPLPVPPPRRLLARVSIAAAPSSRRESDRRPNARVCLFSAPSILGLAVVSIGQI